MLDEHLVHVVRGDGGIDGGAAELEEGVAPHAEGGVGFALLLDHAAQGGDDVRDVLLEALDGFLELAHFRVLEGDVGGEEFVERLVLFE